MKTSMKSTRLYSVETSINGVIENFRIKFTELIDEDSRTETIFCLHVRIDDIMDLKKNEAMYFQPNRDNSESKGIITRIR